MAIRLRLSEGCESRRVFGVPSDNPEDYIMQGYFADMEVGEDIPFKAEIKLGGNGIALLFNDEDYYDLNIGTATRNISKGEKGRILLHGFMIRKEETDAFEQMIRAGVAMALGWAITEALL